jgi:hypothetical protein
MIFDPGTDGTPRFTGIHPLLAELLRAAALDPWERCPARSARLTPPPGDDEELRHDWEDHVQPELRRHFETERTVVASDLAGLKAEAEAEDAAAGSEQYPTWSLEIPPAHAEAWLTTLNALRLALAEEHGLTEADLSRHEEPDFSTERGLTLMQVNFYAFVQECLLLVLDERGGGAA